MVTSFIKQSKTIQININELVPHIKFKKGKIINNK